MKSKHFIKQDCAGMKIQTNTKLKKAHPPKLNQLMSGYEIIAEVFTYRHSFTGMFELLTS